MTKKPSTINVIAQKSGIGVETIRYYQRISLITEPEKPQFGYRVYGEDTLTRLLFIKRAKELGFSLAEIAQLLSWEGGSCAETKAVAVHKLEIIQSKLQDLHTIANTLETLIHSCETQVDLQECPIISAILQR
jgi:MerR family transcriptional regulator, mercuric resistance operon regulatory protein